MVSLTTAQFEFKIPSHAIGGFHFLLHVKFTFYRITFFIIGKLTNFYIKLFMILFLLVINNS